VGCVTDDFSFTSATTTKNFTEEEDYDYMKVGSSIFMEKK
jgi:hypothetical protein